MDDCATHMEKNMVPNCDPLYWTYFTRSMLALQAIEYALINIGGDMVQQWISMDTCIKPLNMTKLIPPLQCKETTAYTHCLEKFTDMSNSSTIGYGPFEQTDHQEALLQNGLPFLKHIVSHIKLNVSRVFQNVRIDHR
ncbi:hypothetical protein R5R35_010540 [Gryllus longicercus]|uniref:Uncharacterized protein n=1 Tax=Gryllus longicercus TaxID=2509291 RepID=A0AAN9YYV2_9ORTH|nr:Protein of unknown function [Gryllus bimaculatus]